MTVTELDAETIIIKLYKTPYEGETH